MIFPFFLGFLLFRFLVAQKRNTQGRSLIHYCLSHSIVPFSNIHPTHNALHLMHIHIDHSTSQHVITGGEGHGNTEHDHTNIHIGMTKRNEFPISSADSIPSTEKMNGWSHSSSQSKQGGWNDKEIERIKPK
jgi:hypothetical protein